MANINEFDNENINGTNGFVPSDNNGTPKIPDTETGSTEAGNQNTESINDTTELNVNEAPVNSAAENDDVINHDIFAENIDDSNVAHMDDVSVHHNHEKEDGFTPVPQYTNHMNESQNINSSTQVPSSGIYGNIPPRQPAESAGIRYNADKNSSNGNYTWQYCNTENPPYNQNAAPVKKNGALKAVSLTLACVLAIGIIGVFTYFAIQHLKYGEFRPREEYNNEITPPDHKIPEITPDKDKDLPVIGRHDESELPGPGNGSGNVLIVPDENGVLTKQMIAVKCKPSSVGIEVTAITQSYFGSYRSSGVGSGFILTEDGYIATNNHVIEGADEITVMLDDGTKYSAEIIGTDSVTDLAVIKIDATGLIPMEIGDSDLMQVGDSVIAIGTPAGIEFAGTVTDGIVSAVNRGVEVQGSNGYTKTMTLMQTNAAINPGNSGGPLINNKGQVIGINTLKLTEEYEGIGFSIPINSAVSIINQLIRDGHVSSYEQSFVTGNGAIGITTVEVTEEESKYYGIPVGVMVIQVKPGSSAAAAGLKRGDIITAFNGKKVTTTAEINEYKSDFKAGDEVTITVYRDPNETIDITFNLDVMG